MVNRAMFKRACEIYCSTRSSDTFYTDKGPGGDAGIHYRSLGGGVYLAGGVNYLIKQNLVLLRDGGDPVLYSLNTRSEEKRCAGLAWLEVSHGEET